MRRALPFVLFALAVVMALWLSAQPDRGRPSAALELRESPPPVAAGPSDPAASRQNAVWPPPSDSEAPQRAVPAAPQAEPVPEPSSANDESNAEPDPEVFATLEKFLDPDAAGADARVEDPDTGAPEFDEAAFQANAAPQRDVFTVVLPQRREKKHGSSLDRKPARSDPPALMPIAAAPAPAPVVTTPPPPVVVPPPMPNFPTPPTPSPSGGLWSGDLSNLPPAIQQIEELRIETNRSQAAGWTSSGSGSE